MINIKEIAKRGNDAYLQNCSKCKYGIIKYGHKYCSDLDDYVDSFGDYICPKKDPDKRYCSKYDTYCWKENTCDKCPIE